MTEQDVNHRYDVYAQARLWLLGAMLVVVLVGTSGTLWLLASADDQRANSRATLASTQDAIDLLVECTTAPQFRDPPQDPKKVATSDCYVRSHADADDLVGEPRGPLNTVAVLAAACGAAHPGDIPATRACVDKGLGQ